MCFFLTTVAPDLKGVEGKPYFDKYPYLERSDLPRTAGLVARPRPLVARPASTSADAPTKPTAATKALLPISLSGAK